MPTSVADYQFKYQVNGTDVGDSRHLDQWTTISTYYHSPNGYFSNTNVAVIPFCLDTTSYQPTGTLNFSRIDKFQIVTPETVPFTQMVTGPYLYAVGYNILEVKDGTASLLYWD